MKNIATTNEKVSEFLFRFLIFLGVFDGVRGWMVNWGQSLSLLKELVTLALLVLLFSRRNLTLSKSKLRYSNFLFIAYLCTIALVMIILNDYSDIESLSIYRPEQPNKYVIHFKTIEAFIIIYLFLNYKLLTGKEMSELMPYFIKQCVVFVMLTMVAYFVIDLSWIFEAHWLGRISIGYPPADAQVLCFGLAYMIFGRHPFSSFFSTIIKLFLVLGILMNATGTSFLALVFMVLFFIVRLFVVGDWARVQLRTIGFAFFALITSIVLAQFLNNKVQEIEEFKNQFEHKFETVSKRVFNTLGISHEAIVGDISFELRDNQIEVSLIKKNDFLSKLFGGPISIGTLIENQNFFLFRSYGYLGVILYYGWIALLIIKAISNIKNDYGQLLLISTVVLIISNLSNITTYMYGIAASFALLVAFCLTEVDSRPMPFSQDNA